MATNAHRRARAKWRATHREKYAKQAARSRMRARWAREFAKMGVSYRDLVPTAPTDVVPWARSKAAEMMDAYEGYLARQSHQCFVCHETRDLTVPVWDTNNVLAGFACEACRLYVEEEK